MGGKFPLDCAGQSRLSPLCSRQHPRHPRPAHQEPPVQPLQVQSQRKRLTGVGLAQQLRQIDPQRIPATTPARQLPRVEVHPAPNRLNQAPPRHASSGAIPQRPIQLAIAPLRREKLPPQLQAQGRRVRQAVGEIVPDPNLPPRLPQLAQPPLHHLPRRPPLGPRPNSTRPNSTRPNSTRPSGPRLQQPHARIGHPPLKIQRLTPLPLQPQRQRTQLAQRLPGESLQHRRQQSRR